MAAILSSWLNDDVLLSKKITPKTLEYEFRSGFYFAEVLSRFHLLHPHSLQSFQKPIAPVKEHELPPFPFKKNFVLQPDPAVLFEEVAISNFIKLEALLRDKLAISLSANDAFDIIQGRRDSSARLLLRMKSAIEELVKTRKVNQDMEEAMKNNTGFFGDYNAQNQLGPSTSRDLDDVIVQKKKKELQARNTTTLVFYNTVKEAKGHKDHEYFEQQLRYKIRRFKNPTSNNNGLSDIIKGAPVGEVLDKIIARRDVIRMDSSGVMLSEKITKEKSLQGDVDIDNELSPGEKPHILAPVVDRALLQKQRQAEKEKVKDNILC
jgi:hypothetical protein